ncbi:hypothetical protein [Streptomyces sp. 2131.1]|uniref:hypothetical protein n=1 Tax=Streptomyces sp. 2131.1 TaxID=1855346 RepID=UPI00352427F0
MNQLRPVRVSGDGEVPETAPSPDSAAERGRVLMPVAYLAAKWGVGERNPGKIVWCEFAAPARLSAEIPR